MAIFVFIKQFDPNINWNMVTVGLNSYPNSLLTSNSVWSQKFLQHYGLAMWVTTAEIEMDEEEGKEK
jgi:hypothetical protein